MVGVSLSRWTMTYFVTAIGALLVSECLMMLGYGFPSNTLQSPETLVVVHIIVIGWLSLLMCGALFQFVPVLIASPLFDNSLPLPAFAFILTGLSTLVAGFLSLNGTIHASVWLLPTAAGFLVSGFALVIYNLGRTLWTVRPLPLPAKFVVVGLCSLVITILLGALFASSFTSLITSETLLSVANNGVPFHAVAGIAGWLTFAAIGVSYRLLAMFMLAPEYEHTKARGVFWTGATALAVTLISGLTLLAIGKPVSPAAFLGGVLALTALALYGTDMIHLYKKRKRRIIELNSQMAALALTSLVASAVLALGLIGLNLLPQYIAALGFLIVFGWLSGLGLAKLYKIIAFLTWLESFGPIIGKVSIPRVQDLVVEPQARKWFYLYFLSTWSATSTLLTSNSNFFRFATGAMLISSLGIAGHLARTRLLLNIRRKDGLPNGAKIPHFLFSSSSTPHNSGGN